MKRLATLLLLASSWCAAQQQPNIGQNACQDPNAILQAVAASTSGTSAVQVIALASGAKVFLCSMNVVGVSGTSPTFSLVYGTGTNCGTGQTTIVGSFGTTANTLYPFNNPFFVTPAGQAICYLDGGTSPVQRLAITYVQR